MRKTAKVVRPAFGKLAQEYRQYDPDPTMLETVRLLQQSNQRRSVIVRRSGVSYTTLKQWENGKTKRPQAATMRFVLRALGFEIVIQRSREAA